MSFVWLNMILKKLLVLYLICHNLKSVCVECNPSAKCGAHLKTSSNQIQERRWTAMCIDLPKALQFYIHLHSWKIAITCRLFETFYCKGSGSYEIKLSFSVMRFGIWISWNMPHSHESATNVYPSLLSESGLSPVLTWAINFLWSSIQKLLPPVWICLNSR